MPVFRLVRTAYDVDGRAVEVCDTIMAADAYLLSTSCPRWHTTASLLKKLGVPARDAMVILGHSRISVTLEIYTHVDEESRRDAVGRIDRLLSGPALRPDRV